jgi:hypothetical protein
MWYILRLTKECKTLSQTGFHITLAGMTVPVSTLKRSYENLVKKHPKYWSPENDENPRVHNWNHRQKTQGLEAVQFFRGIADSWECSVVRVILFGRKTLCRYGYWRLTEWWICLLHLPFCEKWWLSLEYSFLVNLLAAKGTAADGQEWGAWKMEELRCMWETGLTGSLCHLMGSEAFTNGLPPFHHLEFSLQLVPFTHTLLSSFLLLPAS